MAMSTECAFFRACERGDLEECKELYRRLNSTVSIYEYPSTPLLEDSFYGRHKCPPLHAAAWHGHTHVVRFLLDDCGVGVDETPWIPEEEEGQLVEHVGVAGTALFRACERGHVETCRALLQGGALHQSGLCAYRAAEMGQAQLLRVLLEFGANPESTCPYPIRHRPPLHLAILEGRPEILQLLLQHGCRLFRRGRISSSISVEKLRPQNEARIFQVLVQHAPPHALALCLVDVLLRHPISVFIGLVEAGANVHTRTMPNYGGGITPLEALLRKQSEYTWRREECLETTQWLIQTNGINPDSSNWEDCFEWIVQIGDSVLLQWILQYWKTIHTTTNVDGDHPIHVACQIPRTSYKSVEFLVRDNPSSLSVVGGQSGQLALHMACSHGLSLDALYTLLRQRPETLWWAHDASSVGTKQHHEHNATASRHPVEMELQHAAKKPRLLG
ncbi:Ankyrin Repeat Protein [Seminavis robusta]|uniref:Ankyrin Repeat Protein n=1 Tax=Seminavis robusta TaxID=568900 RepID=A0A9N8H6W3_9STRA|nr:Ankyrin Repeat Protein [Seminavis robusta]|eukprot:Sro111_g055460.1 Ankyrin Repeat Protein (445) ;mRNA; r:115234-116568